MPDNPFAGLFGGGQPRPGEQGDPGIMARPAPQGSLRTLFGAPTYQEAGAKAEGDVMKALSENHARNGGNPQRAILDFLNSPGGVQHITNMALSGKEPTDIFKKWVDTVTPPQTKLGPGEGLQVGTPGTPGSQFVSNPTAAVQTLRDLTKMVNLDPDSQKDLAIGLAGGDRAAMAWRQLATKGIISQDTALKGQAGAFKEITLVNDKGEVVGKTIVDITNPANISGPAPGTPVNPTSTTAPNAKGEETAPVVAPSEALKKVLADPKESMALGSGGMAIGQGIIGSAMRVVDPHFNDPDSQLTNDRRSALSLTRAALAEHPSARGPIAEKVKALIGTLPSTGVFQDPLDATNKLDALRDYAQEQYNKDTATYKDVMHQSKEIRNDAGKSAQAWGKVLDTLPSKASNAAIREALAASKAGVTASDVIGTAARAPAGAGDIVRQGAEALGVTVKGGKQPAAAKPAATNEKGKVSIPPEQVRTMSREQIEALSAENLSPETRAAIRSRIQELRSKIRQQ